MFPTTVTLLVMLLLWKIEGESEDEKLRDSKIVGNGSEEDVHYWEHLIEHYWEHFVDHYGLPFGNTCISFLYAVYLRFTLFNVTMFLVKSVPTSLYMYKFLKSMYKASRERIKQKQMELEDIQLQIQIVNNKLCVREAEFKEREEQLRRSVEQLRRVRCRVNNVIASDEALRSGLDGEALWEPDQGNNNVQTTPEQDREFIVELLKWLKYENVTMPEMMEYGEHVPEANSPETSGYASLNEDGKQNCRVRILKVTNVYRVAYLKHIIKQKRRRRAHKHALLKKRFESIKKLLEDWQTSLKMVINSKLSIMNMESCLDAASQEAMGDYSKPALRECVSDSELASSSPDAFYDEYGHSWAQNPYRTYCYGYQDMPEPTISREYREPQNFAVVKCPLSVVQKCEYLETWNRLSTMPEETSSQLAIEEIKSETDIACQDHDVDEA